MNRDYLLRLNTWAYREKDPRDLSPKGLHPLNTRQILKCPLNGA